MGREGERRGDPPHGCSGPGGDGGSRRPQRARPVISGGGVCVACSSPQATEAAVRLVGLLSTTPGREPPGPALACC